jgi:hypothetical protein
MRRHQKRKTISAVEKCHDAVTCYDAVSVTPARVGNYYTNQVATLHHTRHRDPAGNPLDKLAKRVEAGAP